MYLDGIGVKKNNAEAFYWFKKAALQGLPISQLALSEMYFLGIGTPKDIYLAKQWKDKATQKL